MKEPRKPSYFEIGYGKPPAETRFKKGQSGNPKGRGRGKVKLPAEHPLDRLIPIKVDGKPKMVTVTDALVTKTIEAAFNDDQVARRDMFRYAVQRDATARKAGVGRGEEQESPPGPPTSIRFATYDAGALESLGIVVEEHGEFKLRTAFALAALARLSPDYLANLDFDKLAYSLEDPSVLDPYRPKPA